MRYQPHEEEYAAIAHMTDEDLLEYFLYRIMETDEVWGLKLNSQRLTRTINGLETRPVWPYRRYAEEAAAREWQNHTSIADSLEHFIYETLNRLAVQDICIEIMPRPSAAGCLISAQRLFSYLEAMKESRDFVLDD
jgi:hypothetical protein